MLAPCNWHEQTEGTGDRGGSGLLMNGNFREAGLKTQQGFTLIELMVVVVVIGILAAVAVPSYTEYITRGRIPDATSNLATKRVKLEQFYQDNRTYVAAPDCSSDTTTSSYFNFSCTAGPTATTPPRVVSRCRRA